MIPNIHAFRIYYEPIRTDRSQQQRATALVDVQNFRSRDFPILAQIE